jgi:hypothetical protein
MPLNFYRLHQLLNEYGSSLVNRLIEKFKKEHPDLSSDTIKSYIDNFDKIKNNLPVEKRDISKLSWQELENLVDSNQPKQRIKAGKLDSTVSDANLLYNQDGVRIYLGKDKKSCIKYSNGYSFCIGARGDRNMYTNYRFSKGGTPYFIFNDNLPKENQNHVLVLFVYKNRPLIKTTIAKTNIFSITNANNEGEMTYKSINDIVNNFPWTKPIKLFVDDENKGIVEPSSLEYLEHHLKRHFISNDRPMLDSLYSSIRNAAQISEILLKDNAIDDFLNKKKNIAWYAVLIPGDGWYSDENFDFYITYSNEDEILPKLKEKINYLSRKFEYKDISNINEKIKKALQSPNDQRIPDFITGWIDESELSPNVMIISNKNNEEYYNYFFLKIVDMRKDIENFIKEEKELIDNLKNNKKRYKKILFYINNISEDKINQIVDFHKENNKTPTFETIETFMN